MSDSPETRQRRWPWLLAAGGVVVLLLGAGWSWLREPAPEAELVGGNTPINSGAGDRLDARAYNSPEVVADPTDPDQLAVVSRVDLPQFDCALHVSDDGGASWQVARILPPPEAGDPACFSPSAAFGADGRLYVSYASFADLPKEGVVPNAVWVAVSEDGGDNLSDPVKAAGPLGFHVRVAADPETPGRAYLTWVQTDGASGFGPTTAGNPVVAVRTDDGGETWSDPVEVSASDRPRVITPVPAVGEDGRLHLAYLDVGDDRLDYHGAHQGEGGPPHQGPWSLLVATSEDGGETWQRRVVTNDLTPIERFVMLFPPAPAIATDGAHGRVYVAFHDATDSPADVWLWASPDHGDSWDEAARVNDTPAGDDSAQRLPAVAAAPNGRVDVAYYDGRGDPGGSMTEVSWQSSFDGGATFTPRVALSTVGFDATIGYGSDRDLPQLGDRLGLVATDAGALAAWADTRADEAVTGKQDLVSAVVSVTGPTPLRGPLGLSTRVLGMAGFALAMGVAVAAFRLRARRTSSAGADPDATEPAAQPPARKEADRV